MLPQEYSEYFEVISERRGNLLNYEKLSQAAIGEDLEIYHVYQMILALAKGPEITEASFMEPDEQFLFNQVSSKETLPTTLEEKDLLGYFLPSPTIKNPYEGTTYSTREGVNEIYVRNSLSLTDKAVTLGHELGHDYKYSIGERWNYEKSHNFLEIYLQNIENIIKKYSW